MVKPFQALMAAMMLLAWPVSAQLRPSKGTQIKVPLGNLGASDELCDYCSPTGVCCSEVCPEYGYPFSACQTKKDCYDDGTYLYCLCSIEKVCDGGVVQSSLPLLTLPIERKL